MNFSELIQEVKNTALTEEITLCFYGKNYRILSNEAALINELRSYFSEWISTKNEEPTATITAWQSETPDFGLDYQQYRESPKKRIKEAFADVDGFRIVKKLKTGVHFAIGKNEWFAFGPLTKYPNQLINFVNAIFMEINLAGNAYLFHAAGVALNQQGIVIAAQSGKGKSTTSLLLMNEGLDFVSNDRIILQKKEKGYTMIGVPKHPRVNPGTLLNNPKIKPILKAPERFANKTRNEIWNWEEKYDVLIPEIYGAGKFTLAAEAKAFLIIDWGEEENELRLEKLDLANRTDLFPAIMKKPSLMTPNIHAEKKDLSAEDYLTFLNDLPVYQLRGKIDPKKGLHLILKEFFEKN